MSLALLSAAHPAVSSRRHFIAGVAALSLGLGSDQHAIARQSTPTTQGRLVVAVSIPVLADIVSNVAGDLAEVYPVIPAGADPHTWEAVPQDMVHVIERDSLVADGLSLIPHVA
jgi:ABC-type Zn uptake system ZnuABC Zn-binding protein ZnuA